MTVHGELQVFLTQLLLYLVLLLPVAYAAARTWLQVKANGKRIDNLPTHSEVDAKLQKFVDDRLQENGVNTK